jgi:hypothetical protein
MTPPIINWCGAEEELNYGRVVKIRKMLCPPWIPIEKLLRSTVIMQE